MEKHKNYKLYMCDNSKTHNIDKVVYVWQLKNTKNISCDNYNIFFLEWEPSLLWTAFIAKKQNI